MIGIIVPSLTDTERLAAAGADFFEPYVIGNYEASQPADENTHPSYVALFPARLAVSDPATDPQTVADYLGQVVPRIAETAEPGAFVVLGSGKARTRPAHVRPDDAEEAFIRSYAMASEACRHHGLELLLEPLRPQETNLVCSFREGVDLLDRHGFTEARLVWDTFHAVQSNDDPADVTTSLDRVAHLHHSGPDRRPPSLGAEAETVMLRAALDAGFTGHVSLECLVDSPDDVRDSVTELRGILQGR